MQLWLFLSKNVLRGGSKNTFIAFYLKSGAKRVFAFMISGLSMREERACFIAYEENKKRNCL